MSRDPPCHHRQMLLPIVVPRMVSSTINSTRCSSTYPMLLTTIYPTIGASTTQRRCLLCPVSTARGWKIALSMHQLPFGVCRLCTQCSLRRAFAFSIPTAPILLLWSITPLGVIERGIILIFIPLLTLLADMMHKFEEYNPTWGNVGVYHLDELYDCNRQLYHSLLCGCTSLGRDTSSTFFILLSPQFLFLINHRDALDIFVSCAHERTLTLRVIAMDEAHIHVQHGTSFREDICALRIKFFRKVYGNQPRDLRPRLIALMATFPTTYVALLSTLLTVDMSIGDCVVRDSAICYCQWCVPEAV